MPPQYIFQRQNIIEIPKIIYGIIKTLAYLHSYCLSSKKLFSHFTISLLDRVWKDTLEDTPTRTSEGGHSRGHTFFSKQTDKPCGFKSRDVLQSRSGVNSIDIFQRFKLSCPPGCLRGVLS
jgi:hypothetical protein